jgi:competence ComEA-like helix-hairpin-helix protein
MLLARWWSTPQPATPLRGHLLIDVNTASAEELSVLPHVGPTLARRVVENRERLGRFATVDDLTRVHGVGQNTLQKIRPYCVAVCNPTTDSTQLTTDN